MLSSCEKGMLFLKLGCVTQAPRATFKGSICGGLNTVNHRGILAWTGRDSLSRYSLLQYRENKESIIDEVL